MDYEKLGFKAGLELHQQVASSRKLFCHCPPVKSESFPFETRRRIRASAGELGEVDIAARYEHAKDIEYIYRFNPESACLLELDEMPCEPLDAEALSVALQVSKVLGSDVVDEIHVMRKTVVDGSAVSGFQRTALVGLGGKISTSKGPVRVTNVQLEEDSATQLEKSEGKIVYRLDRLGVPLIELGTEPDIKDPEHLQETALRFGQLFRATRCVKRGIGSIRQDVNVSIRGGSRVEIKGAQDLRLLPTIAEREVQRQLSLLQVKDELQSRGAEVERHATDVSDIFRDAASPILKGKFVAALRFKKFAGLLGKELQPGRRVGTELADHAKAAGLGGLIHSDEDLRKYGFVSEVEQVKQRLALEPGDAFVLLAGARRQAELAAGLVIRRARQLHFGVPKETRRALPDGNTAFMRPMPGAARLYPETDVPYVVVTSALLKKIPLPEPPDKSRARLREAGLSEDLVVKLIASENIGLFEKIRTKSPAVAAWALTDLWTEVSREGLDIDEVDDAKIVEMFKLFDSGKLARDSLPDALRSLARAPAGASAGEALESFSKLPESRVRDVVRLAIDANRDALAKPTAFNIIMGLVMEQLRGKADGSVIARVVKDELSKAS
jgi:glutamyl-tRNA(Gln) amidotransferase subunit E